MANVYFITVLIFVQASVFIKAAAPFITTHPRSVTTAEGSSVTLSCNASGDPEPTFSWTKNGTTVNTNANPRITLSSQNKQLTITNVRRADSGQYRCVATNINGTTTSNVSTLDVRPGSSTSSTPASRSASATPSTSTSASAGSTTSGTPTSTSASTTPSTSTITSAGSTTSSTPTSTSASTTPSTPTSTSPSTTPGPTTAGPPSSSMVQSTPAGRPGITTQPQNTPTAEGSNVTLSCNASGDPVLTISWTKDGSTLSASGNSRINFGGDNKTLTISNVNKADIGEYRCVAANSLGNAISNPATLDVQFAPEITTHPQNATTAEGSAVTLYCNASGNPEPTFSWTKDGTAVKTTANPRITLSSQNKQLSIINVNITDNGQYRCVATNIHGNATSNAATLDVRPAPQITTHPENMTTTEGRNVTLSCNASGDPEPTFSWTKDGSTLSASGNSRINLRGGNKTLTITNVNKADSGEYRCVAINSLGKATSYPATLDVQFAPEITTHPQNVTTAEGSTVTLSCNAIGNPEPTFSWTKNGTTVKTTANPRITLSLQNKKLTITIVDRTDSGQYRCVAINILGTVTSNAATLDVQGTIVVVCFYIKVSSCSDNILLITISTNVKNAYKQGQTDIVLKVELYSSYCVPCTSCIVYLRVCIKITFKLGISGVDIEKTFKNEIADGLLGNLPVSETQYNVTFQGVNIKDVVKAGECKRVCCGAGGPLKFEQKCTAGTHKCEGFVGKEIEQTGHCHGGDGDVCKDVQCDTGVSSHLPSFSLLILLTTASFFKLRV